MRFPISTAAIVESLSEGHPVRLGSEIEELILRRLVDSRRCGLCGARQHEMCRVYGGYPTLMRTHALRLQMTRRERASMVRWAVRESARRVRSGEDASSWRGPDLNR